MGKLLRPLFALLTVPLIIFLIIWGSGQIVALTTDKYRFEAASDLPEADAVVVFGAGLKRNGEPGSVLQGRLNDAVTVYQEKKAPKVVVSGDNILESYDEVTPMVTYLVDKGIPKEDIIPDRVGISTYDTCYSLVNTLKIKKAILVTNAFHLPRAVFTCRKLGADAFGIATPNYAGYEYNSNQRESLARVKMLIDLYIAPPTPAKLEPTPSPIPL